MEETKSQVIERVSKLVENKSYDAFYAAMKVPYVRNENEDNLVAVERHIKNMSEAFSKKMKGVITDIYENMNDYTIAQDDSSFTSLP